MRSSGPSSFIPPELLPHLYHSLQHVSSCGCDPGLLRQVGEVSEEGEEEEEDSIVQLFFCGITGVV